MNARLPLSGRSGPGPLVAADGLPRSVRPKHLAIKPQPVGTLRLLGAPEGLRRPWRRTSETPFGPTVGVSVKEATGSWTF